MQFPEQQLVGAAQEGKNNWRSFRQMGQAVMMGKGECKNYSWCNTFNSQVTSPKHVFAHAQGEN